MESWPSPNAPTLELQNSDSSENDMANLMRQINAMTTQTSMERTNPKQVQEQQITQGQWE